MQTHRDVLVSHSLTHTRLSHPSSFVPIFLCSPPTVNFNGCHPQRVLMFYYNAPSCEELGVCPTGLHYYPDYATETQFEYSSVEVWNDKEYSCSLRWTPVAPSFLGLNSFLSIPSEAAAQTLNSYDNVKNHVEVCSTSTGQDINFYIADFWSVGDIPRFTQEYNFVKTLNKRGRRRLRHNP